MAAAPKFDLFSLGVESMDVEHRQLADLLTAFVACVRGDEPLDRAHSIVQEAIAVANAHFEHEEALIDKSDYPQAEDHKFRHRNLRLKFTTLIGDTVSIKAHDSVTLENLDIMRQLLEEHISGPDRKLAAHLKTAGIK
jgi:hemerythrin-like metal-binding protein